MIDTPPVIPVGQEPPPLRPPSINGRHQGHQGRAKGKPARQKTTGRFALVNAFVDFTAGTLSRAELLVWLVLWRDTKPDGIARTGQADLARRAGVNVRTVKRAVATLNRRGLLVVVHRGSLRRGPSTYRVRPLTTRKEW